ncbi:MAG: non-ribosomal peptide synthetase [Verrucomicrobiota bacterium]
MVATTPDTTLRERIEGIASQSSNNHLLEAPGHEPLSYAAVLELIAHISQYFQDASANSHPRIAIAVTDSPQSVTCFLAAMSAGVACPVNPRERLSSYREYFRELKPDLLVWSRDANEAAVEAAQGLALPVHELVRPPSGPAGEFSLEQIHETATAAQRPQGAVEDIALILPTSGSTGMPKRAPHRLHHLWTTACNTAATLELSASDRNLLAIPMFHAHGLVSGVLMPLVSGGTIVCPGIFAIEHWDDWMATYRPTWYSVGPTVHREIMAHLRERDVMRPYPALRFVRSGSAPLESSFIREVNERLGVPLIEAYGLSEAPHVSCNPIQSPRSGSVGQSVGPKIAIIDDNGCERPTDECGEIALKGETIIRGYDGEEQAPAKHVDQWFRTGDYGRLDENGYLYIEGRIKEIINRGGEKVMPLEVDRALATHPSVSGALSFSVPHPTLGEDIAAAVTLRAGNKVTETELRAHALTALGYIKSPSRILIVPSFPTGPTGKPLRSKLWEAYGSTLDAPYRAPANDAESIICELYASVLRLGQVGADDNFFVLGGDSLKAQRVIARLNAKYTLHCKANLLFRHPTPANLARQLTVEIEESREVEALLEELRQLPPEDLNDILNEAEAS